VGDEFVEAATPGTDENMGNLSERRGESENSDEVEVPVLEEVMKERDDSSNKKPERIFINLDAVEVEGFEDPDKKVFINLDEKEGYVDPDKKVFINLDEVEGYKDPFKKSDKPKGIIQKDLIQLNFRRKSDKPKKIIELNLWPKKKPNWSKDDNGNIRVHEDNNFDDFK